MEQRRATWWLVIGGIMTLGCLGCAPSATGPEADSPEPVSVEVAPASTPLSAADLAPVIQDVGRSGAGARSLVVEFALPVVDGSRLNRPVDDGTRLVLEPPVAGQLRFTSPSTLSFFPDAGFAPGTPYKVTLEAVETRSGLITAPLPNPWIHRFTTPEFAFVRLSLARLDYRRRQVELDLTFSSPVESDEVGRRVHLTAVDAEGADVELGRIRFEAGRERHIVRARLSGQGLRPGLGIRMRLDAGVPAAEDRELRAEAALAEIRLGEGPPVDIAAVYPAEGTNGFYLEVVCDDSAVETKRYYWDPVGRRGYPRISVRCRLRDEDARESVHLEPALPFTISPGGGGFRIFADFARGSYNVRIDGGARSVDGGMLHSEFETDFTVPARKPQVSFMTRGRYLPRKAWRALPVRHLNTDQVTLTVRHVPEENLVFWMSDDDSEVADERTSNQILRHELSLRGDPDTLATTFIDVGSLLSRDTRGLLELRLEGSGAHAAARILLTDLNLVAKRFAPEPGKAWGREIHVWALDSSTNETLRGVRVAAVRKSGFRLASCVTAGEKGCRLELPVADSDPSPPFALVASRGEDVTYLRFGDLKAEVEETRIAGEPYRAEASYRAAVYSDRGVYRPGETAHLVAIVRNEESLAPPAGMPVEWRLLDPRGKTVKQLTLSTNPAGVVDLDLGFAAFASTGRYEAQVLAAQRRIGRYPFQVEEFVPERMKVEASAREDEYLLGSQMGFGVEARYLFGGVPAQHRVELSCELEPGSFEPEANGNYHYGVWSEDGADLKPLALGSVTGSLDEAGKALLQCPGAGRGGGFQGPARLVARAAVFEAGSGRTTVGQATVPVHPERFYLGLSTGTREVEPGNEVAINGVVVDWAGELVTAPSQVKLEFLRLEREYGWYYDEGQGRETYRRYLRSMPEGEETVAVTAGRFQTVWKPRTGAEGYLVRARAGGARTDLKLEGGGRYYWWGPNESEVDQTPRPDKPTWLALSLADAVRVGEEIEVSLQAPYRGRVLFTAETDHLLASRWKRADAGEVSWSFRLDRFEPNVYVTAFLVKDPHLDSADAYLPDRAYGVRSVLVKPEEFTHPLSLSVPSQVRSNSSMTVSLDVGPTAGPTFATVAAVDEGVLSLTRFEDPDPFATVFARRALGVETFETVGWTVLVPPGTPSGSPGGGEGGGLGRVQPVKPVALWSGLLPVSEDGRAEITFLVPQYRGELRVMAVTAGPKRMGRDSRRVTVRDPLVLQTTLPRFLTRGDRVEVPVFVTNLSGSRRRIEASLEAHNLPIGGLQARDDGSLPVEVLGSTNQALDLGDGENGVVVFEARALQATGAAKLVATVRSGDLVSREQADVPLLPAGSRTRRVQRIELEAGDTDLTPYLEGWLPLSERSTFWVSANPYGDVFDHLSYLVRYPYGCLEQTTSTLRPLLFLTQLLPNVDPTLLPPGGVDEMVLQGLDRLLSMQTPDGGFAYWPGGTEPASWGTAYATHALLDAQKRRYPVPQGRIDEAVEWMEQQVSHYYQRNRRERSWYTRDAEPYMHLVLAMAGKARKARIEALLGEIGPDPTGEGREHVYMLKAALYLAGDERYEADLRNPDLSPVRNDRSNGWSFYSDRRTRGFMLSTFVDLFGRDPQGERLADVVVQGLRGHRSRWYTTQEIVWGVTGLGKFTEAGATEFAPPELVANGRLLASELDPGASGLDRTWSLARASEYRDLTLRVPDKGEGKLYLILASEGVPEMADPRVGGEGLRLTRRFLDPEGAPIHLREQVLGELVTVELTVTNTSPERIANVALVDRLPAGWEIENPRLGRGGTAAWIDADTLWEADHMDVRDDRLEVFGHLDRGQSRKVVYAVRAVAAGRFALPAVTAEAMYDPGIWARGLAGRVEITGPWR